jgi:hypothetical protein
MQKLIDQNTVPPDGFRFLQSETRTWIRSPDYSNLFVEVREHRKANNLPLGSFWEAEVEDQLCKMLPPGLCKESSPAQTRNVFTRIGWDQVVAGTKTLASWATTGFTAVEQSLADSRANICSRCYFNVGHSGGCHSCGQVQKLAMPLVGTRTTPANPFLKVCAVCRCTLQAKIWAPIEVIDKGTPQQIYNGYPDFCWVRRELDQFRKEQQSG